MKNFQEKRRFKQIVQSKPVLVLFIIVVLAFTWSVYNMALKMSETIKKRKVTEEKIQELQKEKTDLQTNIDQLKTDKGVEENIREKFGFAKDGEGMVVVVDDKNSPKSETESAKPGFFTFLKNLFK